MARGVDVREKGSGNIGATNVARVAGKGLGVLVLVLDALKGALPVLLARSVEPAGSLVPAAVGLAAFAGHVAPPWLGFRGGKGVATALGVLAVLAPRAALAGALTYAVVLAALRISSVGSLLAGIVAVAVAWLVPGTPPASAALTSVLFAGDALDAPGEHRPAAPPRRASRLSPIAPAEPGPAASPWCGG